MNGFKHVELLL